MNQEEWHSWCNGVTDKLTNLEMTLNSCHKTQKRMLFSIILILTGGLGYGLLLQF